VGKILDRNRAILDRIGDLRPIGEKIRSIFVAGKREQLLSARDHEGTPFLTLAKSTLARPRQSPLPFLCHGASSSLIVNYQVDVSFAAAAVTVQAGWPMDWVRYHITGTRKMPRRDPSGFRDEDKRQAIAVLREWVINGS
jgi:hypothetical protein